MKSVISHSLEYLVHPTWVEEAEPLYIWSAINISWNCQIKFFEVSSNSGEKMPIIVLFKSQLPQVKTKKQLCDNNVSISGDYFYYSSWIIIVGRGWIAELWSFCTFYPLFILSLWKVQKHKMNGDNAVKLSIVDKTKTKPAQNTWSEWKWRSRVFHSNLRVPSTLTFSVSFRARPAFALASPGSPFWYNLALQPCSLL